MAQTPTLPSTQSVVDYLKTKGQDSSFGTRSKIYKEAGLGDRLGNFVGSPSQNLNLLKYLQTKDAPQPTPTQVVGQAPIPKTTSTPVDINAAIKSGGLTYDTPKMPVTPPAAPAQPSAVDVLNSAGMKVDAPTAQAPSPTQSSYKGTSINDYLKSTGQAFDFSSRKKLAEGMGITDYRGTAEQNTTLLNNLRGSAQVKQSTDTDATTKQESGVSASSLYPEVLNEDPNEADYVNDWLKSPEGKLFLERQEVQGLTEKAKADALKEELESKYQSDKDKLEQNLAEAGLAFSGIRGTKVRALANALAASELEVDRDLAAKLLDSNLDLREAILDGVADLAKEAADNRKEAIQQLNAIGYAVINGELVPTLAARSAERADRQLEMSERRLELAEAAAARAEARFSEEFGGGKDNGFTYVRELMDLNPNATRAELKAAALENTKLSATEIDSLLDTVGLTPNQQIEVAKSLVGTNLKGGLSGRGGRVTDAQAKAKQIIKSSGGVIKVGGRTVSLTSDQIADLEGFIDTVTFDEAKSAKSLLGKEE